MFQISGSNLGELGDCARRLEAASEAMMLRSGEKEAGSKEMKAALASVAKRAEESAAKAAREQEKGMQVKKSCYYTHIMVHLLHKMCDLPGAVLGLEAGAEEPEQDAGG